MRDLPAALADLAWQTTVLTPSYGMFHRLPGARKFGAVEVRFRGIVESVDAFEVPGSEPQVRNVVFEHPHFSPQGPGQVYCSDEADRPFATDADKFAFFSTVAATWIDQLDDAPDVVHLHDWHAAFYFLLRQYGKDFDRLRDIPTVFTIHNLSYQGVRPFSGDESSLQAWFPDLPLEQSVVRDPRYSDCLNPMAAAIRLADKVSTVSPSYATEICEPSNEELGFIGGEGLEEDLKSANNAGRLVGILNGCNYDRSIGRRPGWQRILNMASEQVAAWANKDPGNSAHVLAQVRLQSLPKRRPKHLLTSIGRLVRQKASLLFEELASGQSALDTLLEDLGSNGVIVILGSGESSYEQRMLEVAERHSNLLFLCGYSETLADPLYRAGDLFLMPSSFEPCGISQMLAMRATQPCVVHGVGGLKDTVENNRSGFVFSGETPQQQATAFVETVGHAVALRNTDNDTWQKICIRAASARFSWAESAQQTIEKLYAHA